VAQLHFKRHKALQSRTEINTPMSQKSHLYTLIQTSFFQGPCFHIGQPIHLSTAPISSLKLTTKP